MIIEIEIFLRSHLLVPKTYLKNRLKNKFNLTPTLKHRA